MEKQIQDIMDALKRETLTEHERLALRRQLQLFMQEHPMRAPLLVRIKDRITMIRVPGMYLVPHAQLVAFALIIVLFAGAGTSFAAEGALPGDALYLIKVNINEPVQGALAFSDGSKAAWNATLVERRLEEAETLAAEGRLTDSNSTIIASLLRSTTQSFDIHLAAMNTVKGGDAAADDVRSDLDTSFAAHTHVLSAISASLPEVKPAIEPVLAAIKKEESSQDNSTAEPRIPNTGSATSSIRDRLELAQRRAQQRLDDARTFAARSKNDVSTSTLAAYSEAASISANAIRQADRDADDGDYQRALQTVTSVIRSSKEAKASLQAAVRMRKNGHFFTNDTDDMTRGKNVSDGEQRKYPQDKKD